MFGNNQMIEINEAFRKTRDFFDFFDDPLFEIQNISDLFNMQSNSQENFKEQKRYGLFTLSHQSSTTSTTFLSMEVEPEEPIRNQSINESSTNQSSKRMSKAERRHLRRQRRKRGEKNGIEASVEGYWTKNFLQFGKKVHISELLKRFGEDFFAENPQINQIKDKAGITMGDYLILYSHPDLQQFWKSFFARKTLYRGLMFSRVEPKFRKIFVKFIYRYEEAFKTQAFDHIADRATITI